MDRPLRPPLLRAEGLVKSYPVPGGRLVVLSGADLSVAPGEAVAIVGASGSGKSTLLHLLGLMDEPDAGSVAYAMDATTANAPGGSARPPVGFVFQFHHLLPELTALENAALPLRIRGLSRRAAGARAREALARVGLSDRAGHLPAALSGGEAARVAVARALAPEPLVLLADEPTGDLDRPTARAVGDVILSEGRRDGRAVVVATHDEELAARADRVLRLREGRLVPA